MSNADSLINLLSLSAQWQFSRTGSWPSYKYGIIGISSKDVDNSLGLMGLMVPDKEGKYVVLFNGDDGGISDRLVWDFEDNNINGITISFRCLSRFLFDGNVAPSDEQFCNSIANLIRIIDFTKDERIKASKAKRPAPGFVYIGNGYWHRSATIVFQYGHPLDIANEIIEPAYIVMGVDENQYFGSMIKSDKPIKNIADAYLAFMPKHIQGVSDENIRRQGEWYFIRITDDPMEFEGAEKFVCNNLTTENLLHTVLRSRNETEESNNHVVFSEVHYLVDDTYGINGGKKINVFGGQWNCIVTHDQHEELDLPVNDSSYWWAIENTAIKSYSEEGVD